MLFGTRNLSVCGVAIHSPIRHFTQLRKDAELPFSSFPFYSSVHVLHLERRPNQEDGEGESRIAATAATQYNERVPDSSSARLGGRQCPHRFALSRSFATVAGPCVPYGGGHLCPPVSRVVVSVLWQVAQGASHEGCGNILGEYHVPTDEAFLCLEDSWGFSMLVQRGVKMERSG